MRKPILFAMLALAALLAFWLARFLPAGVDGLRGLVRDLNTLHQTHGRLVAVLFFAAYVGITALSLPIALWMTLAAGALFGFWQAVVMVSFASAIGATLSFLAARYLLRDWVQARLGHRARAIEEGLERDGSFFLFSLRLIPLLPFFVVNLLMALTRMRALTFYAISQLGMLPGTFVYVNAGTHLGQLRGLGGILSPGMLLSFAALGLMPWAARLGIRLYRRHRAYAPFDRPTSFQRNLIVIGGGAAGLVSAYIAAASRARVTLIEQDRMGGECLNTGCVPSKALIASAHLAHQMRHADALGLSPADPPASLPGLMAHIDRVIARIALHDSAARYEALGVEVRHGQARITDPWTVEITSPAGPPERLTSRAIIIATGAQPVLPDIPGLAEAGALTTDTLWPALRARESLPRHLAVLGGGPAGVELAQSFQRLGVQVTLIEQAPRLLPAEDAEAAALITAALRAEGVTVLTGHSAVACGGDGETRWVRTGHAEQPRRIDCDLILAALGRRPRLDGLGLKALGLATPEGRLPANDYLQTLLPNLLVAGDVAGPFNRTNGAAHQGWYAAMNALFGNLKRMRVDDRVVPRAVFSDPQIAQLGLTEAEATAQGMKFDLTRYDLADLDRAITDGQAQGLIKILTPPGKDRILGVTIAGPQAAEMIAEFALAMRHGLGLSKMLTTSHIYPTLSEASRNAASNWRRAHISPRLLSLAKAFHRWRRG